MNKSKQVKDYGKELLDIHRSLDGLLEDLNDTSVKMEAVDIMEKMYSLRINLATIYQQVPYEDAKKCQDRLLVFDDIVRDSLNIQRWKEVESIR